MPQQPERRPGDSNPEPDARGFFAFLDWRNRRKAARRRT